MNYVAMAIPFFILALLVEFLYGLLRRRNTYRLADTINSLQLGVLSRLRGLISLGLVGFSFHALTNGWTLLDIDGSDPVLWAAAFVAYDLCYYFSHRFGHEWRILWASHVVHHSSEAFNLSTALRQTSTGWLNGIFYLPMYAIGVPLEVMLSVGSLNLIYQFWVHTEHIRRLGWLEWVLVTPSNHRVHHAKNPCYIDRNYGGVFIVWDRLFGTFQDEMDTEPCRYGITRQLNSWNPLWANIHVWYEGLGATRQTPRLWDKFRLWFKSPAWSPPGIAESELDWRAADFDPPSSRYARGWAFVQFWIHTAASLTLLQQASIMPDNNVTLLLLWLVSGLVLQGMALEGRSRIALWELARVAAGTALVFITAPLAQHTLYAFGYLAISAAAVLPLATRSHGKAIPKGWT